MNKPESSDIHKALADKTICNGQSNAEYATAIFKFCGIEEYWTQVDKSHWESSVGELRHKLAQLIQLIKERVVENVHAKLEAAKAADRVKRFLNNEN